MTLGDRTAKSPQETLRLCCYLDLPCWTMEGLRETLTPEHTGPQVALRNGCTGEAPGCPLPSWHFQTQGQSLYHDTQMKAPKVQGGSCGSTLTETGYACFLVPRPVPEQPQLLSPLEQGAELQ